MVRFCANTSLPWYHHYFLQQHTPSLSRRRSMEHNESVFFRHRPKRFWNDRKKLSHFGQNVWKYRLKTLLWRVLMQQWDKWPKCFSKKKPSDEYEQSWRQSAQQRRPGHIASGTYPTTGPCSLASRVSRPSNCCGICAGAAAHTGGKRDYFRSNKR